MGDRANVVIIDESTDLSSKTAVFLYGHWIGYDLPDILAAALKRGKERWKDAPYLARIIFNEMTDQASSTVTGFGISTSITDNEHPLLVVDTRRLVVVEYPEEVYTEHGFSKLDGYEGVAFGEYEGGWQEDAETQEEGAST